MFYNIIRRSVNKWINSDECKIKDLLQYIYSKGFLRDVQIEALQTYLFLKIKCKNKPLAKIFSDGDLETNIDLDSLEISNDFREFLKKDKAARILYEIAIDEEGKLFNNLKNEIKKNYKSINFKTVFDNIFYNVSYTDYIFSLPMGAGKTYLMAMFMYLDLYFAGIEPNNKAFAHNFIVLAPSGLKSSIIPSLKTIQEFDVSWIIPEPAASNLKKLVKFEILSANKSGKKSNKTRDPNVNKIARYQPFEDLMGLIMITNAEKVILNRLDDENNEQIEIFNEERDEQDRAANELRNLIGKIPNLSIFIDEVHHAADEDIKLRKVVKRWNENNSINSVLGFSGTPYLEDSEPVKVDEEFEFSSKTISTVVYYYPLIKGIDNFLKRPQVNSIDDISTNIVESGVKDFLDKYKNLQYANGTIAKLAIYCANIERLEEEVYPVVYEVVKEYGMNPEDVILKYHRGNKEYKAPAGSEAEYAILDTAQSRKRIVLLVQIGKEGWDCKSLTGVILSQKGDCKTNMVLQTACRCLRQVIKGKKETALIWLNKFNRDKLDEQLKNQQHIDIREFQNSSNDEAGIKYIDRTEVLNLPKLDFIQEELQYKTEIKQVITEEEIEKKLEIMLENIDLNYKTEKITEISDIEGKNKSTYIKETEGKRIANYKEWLFEIVKQSMGHIQFTSLAKYDQILRKIFETICFENNNIRYFNELYNIKDIMADIRKAFYNIRKLTVEKKKVEYSIEILNEANLSKAYIADYDEKDLYPNNEEINRIIDYKEEKVDLDKLSREELLNFIKNGQNINLKESNAIECRNKTFHYMPYYFKQSGFEKDVLEYVLEMSEFKNSNLEIYYIGERYFTNFRIKTYKKEDDKIKYIGLYTPDFLMIKREKGKIQKILIIETKGEGYSEQKDFLDKKEYTEKTFIKINNENAGYKKFDYLYIEDTKNKTQIISAIKEKIKNFFEEEV